MPISPRRSGWSIFPLTRITPGYPAALRALLGDHAPLVLFLRGEPSLLELPCISVVGLAAAK